MSILKQLHGLLAEQMQVDKRYLNTPDGVKQATQQLQQKDEEIRASGNDKMVNSQATYQPQ